MSKRFHDSFDFSAKNLHPIFVKLSAITYCEFCCCFCKCCTGWRLPETYFVNHSAFISLSYSLLSPNPEGWNIFSWIRILGPEYARILFDAQVNSEFRNPLLNNSPLLLIFSALFFFCPIQKQPSLQKTPINPKTPIQTLSPCLLAWEIRLHLPSALSISRICFTLRTFLSLSELLYLKSSKRVKFIHARLDRMDYLR